MRFARNALLALTFVFAGPMLGFHNSGATAGLCITSHKTENAGSTAAPVKCADCHQEEA